MTAPAAPRGGRVGRLLVAAAVIAAGMVIADPAGTPAEAAGCQSAQIAVVVSFNSLGGGTQTACVGDVGSGLAALSAAGFGYTFVPNQPGLVCTINGAPNPCNGAPTNAYWSYWTATMGGGWAYSNVGAGNHDPAPGSAEGWSFGGGSSPAVAPPAAIVPAPPPPPPPPPNPAPPPNPPPGGGSVGDTPGGTDAPSGSTGSPEDEPTSPTDSAADPGDSERSDESGAGNDGSTSSPGDADALQPASDSTDSGTPWPVFATIAGLAVLAGAGYWQKRRRSGPPPAGA